MFRSARVKLTMFYLVILLGMSLLLTFSFRLLAEHEYARSSDAQYGALRHLLVRYPWDSQDPDYPSVKPEVAFGNIQDSQQDAVRNKLNHDFVMINMVALIMGGMLSYWFAGRTLKPIEEAHETQARFAADASHELRTPLASMRVENEVFLRQKHFTEDEAREQIESNLEEVQRLEQLSTNLLALTQYEEAALQLEVTPAVPIIADAVTHMAPIAKARGVTLKQDVAAQAIRVHQDSVSQLLTILIDNAIKYGPEKGTVYIKGKRQGLQYVLQVIDEGPGIRDEDLPHIFERLYRGDKARSTKAGGYGLGLALAKQIATANKATLQAHNNKKAGACFELRLDLIKS
jgi:signal transduction histidine kinase